MAMCTSGNLSIKATAGTCRNICAAVVQGGGAASGSLRSLSIAAGKTATPYGMREFYGYNPSSGSISVATCYSSAGVDEFLFNTISASGAWTASKFDPDFVIASFTSSGSGGGKLIAQTENDVPPFLAEATIVYCLTSSPATRACWTITVSDV